MPYVVELSDRAFRDLSELYEVKFVVQSIAAGRWFDGLLAAIRELKDFPRRCPIAPESGQNRRQLRHLLYGHKPHIYRVIFQVDEAAKIVDVVTIRHGARDQFRMN